MLYWKENVNFQEELINSKPIGSNFKSKAPAIAPRDHHAELK